MVPLPRSHFHCVGLPVDRSVKLTTSGEQPEAGVAEKSAVSCALANWVNITKKADKSLILVPIGGFFVFYEYWIPELNPVTLITHLNKKNCVEN